MKETRFTELRNQASHFVDLVERGETVRLPRKRRAIAEIHPVVRDLPSWKRRTVRPLLTGSASGAGSVRVFFGPSALARRCADAAGTAKCRCAAARGAGLNVPARA